MTGTKVLIGTFCLVCLIILFSTWGATQWTAHELGYQPGLGRPWFMLGDTPIYRPWRLFQWWYAYEAYAPGVFARAGFMAAGGGFLGAVVAVIGSLLRARSKKHLTTYGSARWASARDVRKAETGVAWRQPARDLLTCGR